MRKDLIEKIEEALHLLDEIIKHPEHRGLIGAGNARMHLEQDLDRLEKGNMPRLAGVFLRSDFNDKQ
jgi:hypothetical protein